MTSGPVSGQPLPGPPAVDTSAASSGRHRSSSGPAPTARGRRVNRRDIQGLRAVAVVSVVVNHLTGHPRGGFVGVDVFFVISGFLITSLLLRDLEADVDGTRRLAAYLGSFYRRRIRRLLPASLLVILATLVAAKFLVPAARLTTIEHDGGWSAIFWANWHFAAVGTNYFTATGPTSPLQHYWSLSVEEQFYVLWPVLLFIATAAVAVRASRWNRHAAAVVFATVLSAASLWIAFGQSTSDPTVAYFSTYDRAWELGIGAVLAGAMPYLRVPSRWATPLSLGGLVLIAISLFTAHGGAGFPAPGAVLPCVGAAVVLAAGSGRASGNIVLINPVAVWIGDISYSVYLVHFPVIILLKTRMPYADSYFYLTAVALTIGLSVLLYALVEKPILDSRWLLPTGSSRRTGSTPARRRPAVVTAAAGVLACALAAGIYGAAPSSASRYSAEYQQIQQAQRSASDHPSPSPSLAPSPGRTSTPSPPPTPQADRLARLISSALTAKSYTGLQPSMDDVIAGPQATQQFVHCALVALQSAGSCTFGDPRATHLLYLIGDSTSMVYAEALAQVVEHTPGWRMRFAGAYGCHFATVVFQNAAEQDVQNQCQQHTDDVTADIEKSRPDILMVSHAYHNYTVVGQSKTITATQYVGYIGAQLLKVKSYVGRYVVLAPPPGGKDPATCYHPGGAPIECVYRPPALWRKIAPVMQAMASRIGGTYIDSQAWFCTGAGYCPPFAGGTPVMHDSTHAAPGYMTVIWPAMKEAIQQNGLLRG